MNSASGIRFLLHLSRLYGIQTAYYGVYHHRQQASPESLLAVLRSLGVPIVTLQDTFSMWREQCQLLWQEMLEPVIVAWDGIPSLIRVRLPRVIAESLLNCRLKLETGEQQSWEWSGADLTVVKTAEIEGTSYVVKQIMLPVRLPWGYHRLTVEVSGRSQETLIISAPLKAYVLREEPESREWGVFLPLYALYSDKGGGTGNFSDLETLATWLAENGGQVVATLPLLAAFLDDIFEPSPYLPASRLLWNEFYLDIKNIPELKQCPAAQAYLESSSFSKEVESLRQSPLVDYRRQMAFKRRVLEELCQCFFGGLYQPIEFRKFIDRNPVVEDYARFRATCEQQRRSWRFWPQPLRDGVLREADYNEENRRYHLYVQWLAHQQIEGVAKRVSEQGLQLYLDLPVGVHPDGYDVWREREVFIPDTSAGAPPDAVFTRGQNWGFPPLHPNRIREQGYRYVIAYLRHFLKCAHILRIDHVMGLHRLFCIPKGMEASQGVYLRYRAEELYAILSLESHRSKSIIVGEDLGIVPSYVRPAMRKHGLQRMYILHYELATNPRKGLLPVPYNSIASLNTHDMPPFASFWQGLDIKERRELGLLDKEGVRKERAFHQRITRVLSTFLRRKGWLKEAGADTPSVLKACLSFLSASRARIVLVNLEDLWSEIKPQNVPSTRKEYPNWQLKARYSLEQFCQMPRVLDTLRIINQLRKEGGQQDDQRKND